MKHLILLAATWFTVGSLSTLICLFVMPYIKRQQTTQKQRQQRINSYPKAYRITKPQLHNN